MNASFMDEGSLRFTHVYFSSNAIFQLSHSVTQNFVNPLSVNPTKMIKHTVANETLCLLVKVQSRVHQGLNHALYSLKVECTPSIFIKSVPFH